MTIATVKKEEFYPQLITMMNEARRSVHFYSISCCFGFYSYGLKNFKNIYSAIEDRLKKRFDGRYLDVRVIVKIDPDNPMDIYASGRLASLEGRFSNTADSESTREVFRELVGGPGEVEMIQFAIVDGERILVSGKQEEEYNEDLDLVLNISQAGSIFDADDDEKSLDRYKLISA